MSRRDKLDIDSEQIVVLYSVCAQKCAHDRSEISCQGVVVWGLSASATS